jgi:hypothetical protein
MTTPKGPEYQMTGFDAYEAAWDTVSKRLWSALRFNAKGISLSEPFNSLGAMAHSLVRPIRMGKCRRKMAWSRERAGLLDKLLRRSL